MNRAWYWVARVVCLTALAPIGQAATMETLLTNGPTAQRLNVVFLSEGYTAGELSRFPTDAGRVIDAFLTTPPLSEYRGLFNAFAISVASAESGSDHPSSGVSRNTYFNSTYDSYGTEYLVTIDGTGSSRVMTLLQQWMPEYDIVCLLVNDTAYGGSGGFPLVTSVNGQSAAIALHEMGHSFAGLGDEYTTPYPAYPDIEEPNTTRATSRNEIKWNAWIAASTPVPTPATAAYSTVVGLFEGAHYHSTGWYRPKLDCKMRALAAPFCPVCSETLITAAYARLDPIQDCAPSTNAPLNLVGDEPVTFSVTPLVPETHALRVQWYTNEIPVAGATAATWTTSGAGWAAGDQAVRADVWDDTPLVRNDPAQVLRSSRRWTLSVLAPPRLTATVSGEFFSVSWEDEAAGFQLQSTATPEDPLSWSDLLSVEGAGAWNAPVTEGSRLFLRLRRAGN